MRYKPNPNARIQAVEWRGEIEDFPAAWRSLDMFYLNEAGDLVVRTPNGPGRAQVGWFVINGLGGEFYPVPPGIFHTRWVLDDD